MCSVECPLVLLCGHIAAQYRHIWVLIYCFVMTHGYTIETNVGGAHL